MQFRLTYEGKLLATQDNDARSRHKHEIRKKFHPQLKRLWAEMPNLRDRMAAYVVPSVKYSDYLAQEYRTLDYNFVPLVAPQLWLHCSINILFLRPESAGSLIQSGDLDNRIKTVFDALRMPRTKGELGGHDTPDDSEKPFYCLLSDDKLISNVSVETDMLLEPVGEKYDQHDARLVITVKVMPSRVTLDNLDF